LPFQVSRTVFLSFPSFLPQHLITFLLASLPPFPPLSALFGTGNYPRFYIKLCVTMEDKLADLREKVGRGGGREGEMEGGRAGDRPFAGG